MATKSTKTTKTSAAREFDGLTKKEKRQLKLKAKKLKGKALAVGLIFFLLAGGLSTWWCLHTAKTDHFSINGQEEITLTLGETYVDQGATVKEFGRDMSSAVKVKSNLKTQDYVSFTADEVGTYYITYTVTSLKYGFIHKVQKVRLITFVEGSEGGE